MTSTDGVSSSIAAGVGTAGLPDPDSRSDLFVRLHLREKGGIEIQLRSKVEIMYGRQIREEALGVLSRLGVEHARLEIDDRGALPFVIAARVEAALLAAAHSKAGVSGDGLAADAADAPVPPTPPAPASAAAPAASRDSLPERSAPLPEPSPRERQRRSRLYLPGNEPKFMVNAGLHRPNAVILDLEDSVHPDHKAAARLLVRNALLALDFGAAERMVRINQLPLGLSDLDAIIPALPDLILIPKVEDPAQVRAVSDRIDALLPGPKARPVWLMPILESALGIERAFEIARASSRVVALTLGLEDYTADLGVPKTLAGRESLYARTRVVNAARAAGLQAIDSVFGDVGNMEGLAEWARESRGLGFEGMGCVHPRQIGPIHEAFAPSAAELEKAERIVAAFEAAEAEGRAVVSLGSRMIDPPVVARARRLVARARS